MPTLTSPTRSLPRAGFTLPQILAVCEYSLRLVAARGHAVHWCASTMPGEPADYLDRRPHRTLPK